MKTVLIIEPNDELRTSLRDSLQNRYLVYDCCAGAEGLSLMQLNPDVLILDLLLPGIDSLTFLNRISPMRPKHIVVISPLISDSILQCLSRHGVDDVIRKPCRIDFIVDKIDRKDPLPGGRG